MAGSRPSRHKVSRRFGVDVHGTGGAPLQRRITTPPGARQGARRRRQSEYGRQLEEKQKLKAIYGVQERQFRRYVDSGARGDGPHGENVLVLLERRLDNVVYRLGFARSRAMARQLVSHGHVLVDGERVTIPSYLLDPGRTVALTRDAGRLPLVLEELGSGRPLPAWLARDEQEPASGRMSRLPAREEIDVPVDERLALSFYSR
jgi:small subunit ribosomal protein S4